MTILSVGSIFYGDFGMIYALVGDNSILLPLTDVIDTYVFRSIRTSGSMGMSAAVGALSVPDWIYTSHRHK